MIPLAAEGWKEMLIGTIAAVAIGIGGWFVYAPLVVIPLAGWLWLISFFRDPPRRRSYNPGELCAPADGTVTEISELDCYEAIEGPAVRIGIFLSLFNVHVNRSPCAGRVRHRNYRRGRFLDARHPDSGRKNESMTLLIDPDGPMPGPVYVRQVAGLVARRIICHAGPDEHLTAGYRYGLIKFGSRTELIIPRRAATEIRVSVGDRVRGGVTIIARQPVVDLDAVPEVAGSIGGTSE